MRKWLITLLVSTVVTVAFWQFGLANIVWPAHPFLATLGIAVACGIAAQLLLPKTARPRP
jgi:predicted exporter